MPVTFEGTLQPNDETGGAFVAVPPQVMAKLGPTKRPAVVVEVNGVELRTTIAAYGGKSLIGLRRDVRTAAGIALGETVQLTVALDDAPRTIEVPADFAAALAADAEASRIFDGLSHTNRKEYVAWLTDAKRPETRQRRL
ncbi:MAG TPA: YdeI/OmpD-associated family protein, partial [Chloroflexota bacterium]|nr:YdeI/OmpD-associated family protein [Chloroflexota bacterium]